MNDLVEKMPFLFPVFFIGMWVFVSFLLSMLGGWKKLVESYSLDGKFAGKKWHFQSLKIGAVNYNSCVTIGVDKDAVYLSVLPIFRPGHPPLKMSFSDLQGVENKGWIFNRVDINVAKAKEMNIKLSKKQADRIENMADGEWQYQRRS